MAKVVINELLCFIRQNFDKLTTSQLKPVVCNFYKEDDICVAKDILLKDIHPLVSSDTLPRMPNRQGPGKCKQSVDDVFKLFTIVDEQKLWDSLPRFVAEDLSKVPFLNADSVSTINLSKRMEVMERRMSLLEQTVGDNSGGASQDLCSNAITVNSPEEEATIDNEWTTVVRRKKNATKSVQIPKSPSTAQIPKSPSTVGTGTRHTHSDKPRIRQKVIGTRAENEGTSLKTGIEIVKKSVVHVDNLGPDCNEALLKDYLLAADITVISCFKAKSWLRDNEKDSVTAFRVCIPATQRHMIFKSDLWNRGTIIRDWRFKSQQNGSTE